jgi:ATP-binding cassette subfamily F protein 3
MCRSVVEGKAAHKLAPGVRDDDSEAEAGDGSDSEEETGAAGTVFRLVKGHLRQLDGGMEQYTEIAARSAARVGSAA